MWTECYGLTDSDRGKLFSNDQEFKRFLRDFSVNRTLGLDGESSLAEACAEERRKEFREALAAQIKPSKKLETIHSDFRAKFRFKNNVRSLVSKAASLRYPANYCPMDRFSLDSARALRNCDPAKNTFRTTARKFKNIDQNLNIYMGFVRTLKDHNSRVVQEAFTDDSLKHGCPCQDIFHMRMVDIYLMALGGRFDQHISPFEDGHIWPE